MKKRIKFTLCVLGIGVGLAGVGWILNSILQHYGLMFRAWVGTAYFIIMLLLALALSGGIVAIFVKTYLRPQDNRSKRTSQKILSVLGITAVSLGTVWLLLIAFVSATWGHQSEGVEEKYGQKMISYDNSWLDTSITYYEYVNALVCGNKVIGRVSNRTYWFWDLQGNLIETNDEAPTPREVPEKIEILFPPEEMACSFDSTDIRTRSVMSYSADGENWMERNIGYHYRFFFEDTGYLIFSYDWAMMQHEAAAIYKSVDGGKTWQYLSDTPLDKLLQNTVFFDEDTGIFEYGEAGTDSYLLFVTTDGAKTFKIVELPVETQGQTEKIREYIKTL
ncbi:hypothetical protein FACS18949_00920 [Clostridia bacterium]|nr:hypothetical protein FACS18949_00920 [Clostridia bacterium]